MTSLSSTISTVNGTVDRSNSSFKDDSDFLSFCQEVKRINTVQRLILSHCNIGDASLGILVNAALKDHASITEVDLSHNQIGNVGLMILQDCMKKKTYIRQLNLDNNAITDTKNLDELQNLVSQNQAVPPSHAYSSYTPKLTPSYPSVISPQASSTSSATAGTSTGPIPGLAVTGVPRSMSSNMSPQITSSPVAYENSATANSLDEEATPLNGKKGDCCTLL